MNVRHRRRDLRYLVEQELYGPEEQLWIGVMVLQSSCAGSLFLSVAPLLCLWECMFALFTPSVVGSGPPVSPPSVQHACVN